MSFERKAIPEQHYLYVEKTCEYKDIGQAMGEAFGAVFGFTGQHGITPQSMPMSIYMAMPSGPEMTFRGAVMVSAADAAKAQGDIKADKFDAGEAMHTMHKGPYSGLGQTHQALWNHMKENDIEAKMPVWEVYVDDPGDTDETALRTELYRSIA